MWVTLLSVSGFFFWHGNSLAFFGDRFVSLGPETLLSNEFAPSVPIDGISLLHDFLGVDIKV